MTDPFLQGMVLAAAVCFAGFLAGALWILYRQPKDYRYSDPKSSTPPRPDTDVWDNTPLYVPSSWERDSEDIR